MAQGYDKTKTPVTCSIFVMTHNEIRNIPQDRVVTYARLVVDFRPQKAYPNRARITAGGNLIKYPGDITTRTADMTTSKILWNSILSNKGDRFMGLDIRNFYLGNPLDRFEYTKIPITLLPAHVRQQYQLNGDRVKNGFVYLEIKKAIYGLQAGILVKKLLRYRLAPDGYYEVSHTPGTWRHVTRPVQFTLCVEDFGVKYFGKENADHLINTINKPCTCSKDWTGTLYCGITLDWNYKQHDLDISMTK